MAPDLRDELNFLITFPKGDPGVLGMLIDTLWAHREAWTDVDALIRFVRDMPLGIGDGGHTGIQGLAFYVACSVFADGGRVTDIGLDPRGQLRRLLEADGLDADAALAIYDHPAELRERVARAIERFYEEHYRHDLSRRLPCMERSLAAHRAEAYGDPVELQRKLTGRTVVCLEGQCAGDFQHYYFAPSVDVGPYNFCSLLPGIHALIYPCEPQFMHTHDVEGLDERQRLARVYKALSDEHRLRILQLLREREMYAQEVVERTGLHQSVVSRHLTFLRVVNLVNVRRENNMKFYSINPAMGAELKKTLELFGPAEWGRQNAQ
jgi:DNA-binding transcriptional ArsR family regulator